MKTSRMLAGIVGVALAAAGFAAPLAPPTLVLHGGVILPMTEEGAAYEAMAVAGSRIVAVGTDEEILLLAGPETQVVDLEGRTALPGFIDAHAHLLRDSENEGLSPAEAQALALSCGITTAAEMLVEPGDVERYVDWAEHGRVRVRTSLFLAYNGLCGNVHGTWYEAYSPLVEIAPRLSIGGVKLFVERSTCGERPAAISFSEALRPRLSPAGAFWYGEDRPLFSTEELADILHRAGAAGFPVAMHAIGDAAVETALGALALAGPEVTTLRPLILHNLFVRDDLLPLYAATGATPVVESVNACFVDTYDDMLPASCAGVVRRWGDLAASAPHSAAGSDWPWCDGGALKPLFRLANLISPTNVSPAYASWEPCEPLSPAQRVSAWQALRMMTAEAAYALHRETSVGTLEPGKLADIVVLSANPFDVDPQRLAQIDVWMTILDGRIEWEAANAPDGSAPTSAASLDDAVVGP